MLRLSRMLFSCRRQLGSCNGGSWEKSLEYLPDEQIQKRNLTTYPCFWAAKFVHHRSRYIAREGITDDSCSP